MKLKPLKRHLALQPISREHHDGLLLCWKIRTGFAKSIELSRIKKYTDWFYQNHLLPHFEIEEKYIFPILGDDHELIVKAFADHRKLKSLFENQDEKLLDLIEKELESHIRFEERVLFNEIQQIATENEFALILSKHSENRFTGEEWEDRFWISKKS